MALLGKKKKVAPTRRSSVSPQSTKVSSYYTPPSRTHSRPQIDGSKRGEQKKSNTAKSNPRKTLRNIAIVTIASFFLYNLLHLRSDPIVVMDYETTTGQTSVYEPAIKQMLRGSVFNSNKITLRSADLERQITSEFPEIERAVLSPTLVGKRPVAHLRQQELPFTIESQGKTYIIAKDGIVAGEAFMFTGVKKTVLIRDESGVEMKKGTRVLRSDDAEFFAISNYILRSKGRGVELIRLTSVPREAYIKIKDVAYELRVFLDEPADVQIGTFFSAEKTLGERGEVPKVYLDLRAGEKVYWQ